MKLIVMAMLAMLMWGVVRLLFGCIKELSEFVIEAWQQGELER